MLAKATKIVVAVVALLLVAAPALAETHWNLQAVDPNGVGAWSGTYPVIVTGVILNNPEDMLDPTADFIAYDPNNVFPIRFGGRWQIFVQSVDVRDHAGTACWMGQNYGNLPFIHDSNESYTNDEWDAELARLNYDPITTHHFRKGDLVQVTAKNVSSYKGKTNVNEGHNKSTTMDFAITLLDDDYGLPAPDLMTLAMVMNVDDGNDSTHEDIFDHTRREGGEYFQGRRARINDLTIVDDSGWGQEDWDDRICTVTDGAGRIFKLRTPRGSMVNLGPVPTGLFDAIGIFNQEDGDTYGYELYVTEVTPEPACAGLLVLGGLALLRRRRRK